MKYLGLSAYAIQHPKFPVERWLRVMRQVKRRPALALLWNTFGTSLDGIEAFLREFHDRDKLVEIHMSNECARRKRDWGEGEFLPGVSAGEYAKRLRNKQPKTVQAVSRLVSEITEAVNSLAFKWGEVQWVLSTGLEDQLDSEAYKNLVQIVRKIWPYQIARSPLGHNDYRDGAQFTEKHGTQGRGDRKTICNEDQVASPSLAESKKFLAGNKEAFAALIWRKDHQGYGLPRRERKFKISDKDIAELGALLSKY